MELSMDARILQFVWFRGGAKSSVKIGGHGAENVLSARAEAAMRELVAEGYVTAREFNRFGRMEYVGTAKCDGLKPLTMALLEQHGKWSATMPNPERASRRA